MKNKLHGIKPPTLLELADNFTRATATWTSQGFPTPSEEEYQRRAELCNGCKFWNANEWLNVGRCMKCGCSGVKRYMATATCPLGIWEGKPYGDAAVNPPKDAPTSTPDAT